MHADILLGLSIRVYEAFLSKRIDSSHWNLKINSNHAHEQKFWSSSEFIKFLTITIMTVDHRFSLETDLNVVYWGAVMAQW